MKLKFYLWLFMGLIFITGCEKESSPVEVGADPVIESIKMREKWNGKDSTTFHKVEVKTTDPQGFPNIASVLFEVKDQTGSQTVFTDSLFDDGAFYHTQDGDVIASDGVYSNRFNSVQLLSGLADGEYAFYFTAIDNEGHESQIAEQIALFGPNVRPEIVSVSGVDTLFSGTSGEIFQVAVFDSDGVEDVFRVYFETINDSNQLLETIDLYNDGDFTSHGDLFADDSLFSIKLDSTFGVERLGVYRLKFHAEDSFDEENIVVPIHQIFIENEVGTIISTSIPDATSRPADLTLHATVKDPQGLADVDFVYFLLEKPDGTFGGNGTKFDLQDNGDSFYGDLIAGDGIYSKNISIGVSNYPGIYIFHFYMRDKVDHLTPVTKDSITVN